MPGGERHSLPCHPGMSQGSADTQSDPQHLWQRASASRHLANTQTLVLPSPSGAQLSFSRNAPCV